MHFLQVHGILDAVLKAAAVAIFGALVKAGRRLVRSHFHLLQEIRDLLRTDTPGGNADVVHAIRELEQKKPAPRARAAKPKTRPDGEGRG